MRRTSILDDRSTFAVIGACRGIGLEFVRQLVSVSSLYGLVCVSDNVEHQAARPGSTVFATVRTVQSATHLFALAKNLSNVHIVEADVTDYSAMEVDILNYLVLEASR